MAITTSDQGSLSAVTAMLHRSPNASQIPKGRKWFRPIKLEEVELPSPDINVRRLEKAGTIKFWDGRETALILVELVRDHFRYRNAFASEKRRLRRLLLKRRKHGHLSTYRAPVDVLAHDDMKEAGANFGRRRRGSLSILIIKIEEMLMENDQNYRRKAGTTYDEEVGYYGPLISLLIELFEQAKIPQTMWPSPHTIHRARIETKEIKIPFYGPGGASWPVRPGA